MLSALHSRRYGHSPCLLLAKFRDRSAQSRCRLRSSAQTIAPQSAIQALDKFPNGRIREFISYPPDIESVTRMLKKSFDVVIIDLDSDPEYTLELVENISAEGGTNVIVYSETVDPGLMVRCLRAGAREFLHTPITPSAMTEALVRAWARRIEAQPEETVEEEEVAPQDADGKLFVFLSAKGGSGVTTLATSFAVSLAETSGQRTLLIDLNLPLGDAALNLGVRSLYSSVNAFENSSRLDPHFLASLLVKHDSGLFVLAGPSEMTPFQPADDAIGTLLKVALQCFEYVVVDAGSKLDLQRAYRLDGSVTLYLVTQLGIPELRNANRLIKQLPVRRRPHAGSRRQSIRLRLRGARRSAGCQGPHQACSLEDSK